MKTKRKKFLATAAAFVLTAGTACAEDFNLDALIAAAKAEPPLTVYAVTGKIVETAEAFSALYGIPAEGKKVNEAGQIDLMIREHEAGNIVGDLAIAGDVASIVAQLIPEGIAESWVPPDLAAGIPEGQRDPLVVVSDPHVWAYSTEVYDTCPVKNVWELTEPQWQGKVAMLDPLVKPLYADWFNQLEMHHDAEMAAAYEAHFGKKLETDAPSATAAWVRAYAANGPLLGDSSSVAEAIAAVGQKDPFFGMTSTAKFRDNATGKLSIGFCADMVPFSGWLYPGLAMIATKSDSPNAARLFTHYLLTAEGIAPMSIDGKMSSNTAVPANPDEASGIAAHMDQLMVYDTGTAAADFDRRQDWQDYWRTHYNR
jgi:iron(III) transport system substrate-binding protein